MIVQVQERCPDTVTGEVFYGATGNDYRGEFHALKEAWGGGVTCLARVEYGHTETEHLHLRACAFLDACSHAALWWQDHRGRAFFAAGVESYHVNSLDRSSNRVLWSTNSIPTDSDIGSYRIFDGEGRCLVHTTGGRSGYFSIGWLEERRTRQHAYELRWDPLVLRGVVQPMSLVLLGQINMRWLQQHKQRHRSTRPTWCLLCRQKVPKRCRASLQCCVCCRPARPAHQVACGRLHTVHKASSQASLRCRITQGCGASADLRGQKCRCLMLAASPSSTGTQ